MVKHLAIKQSSTPVLSTTTTDDMQTGRHLLNNTSASIGHNWNSTMCVEALLLWERICPLYSRSLNRACQSDGLNASWTYNIPLVVADWLWSNTALLTWTSLINGSVWAVTSSWAFFWDSTILNGIESTQKQHNLLVLVCTVQSPQQDDEFSCGF